MELVSVYCSGSIMKGTSDQKKLYWTDSEREQVRSGASPLDVVFLNPDDPIADPTNTLALFGRDMYQIKVAQAIIVDARERRGLGIGVEMAAAATFGTPVIAVVPRNSLYRKDELDYLGVTVKDYVHPHVSALATVVVDDFAAAGAALAVHRKRPAPEGDVPGWLNAAIDEYCSKVLPDDLPMRKALDRISA
jgi:hypothetical protein